jgi:hypothetical protein
MNKFLDTDDHPKLNQENFNHLTRSITCNGSEAEINSFPKKKHTGPDSTRFYQTFKEELIPTLFKFFYEIERKGTPQNSFYEASITFIRKPDKDTSKKKN